MGSQWAPKVSRNLLIFMVFSYIKIRISTPWEGNPGIYPSVTHFFVGGCQAAQGLMILILCSWTVVTKLWIIKSPNKGVTLTPWQILWELCPQGTPQGSHKTARWVNLCHTMGELMILDLSGTSKRFLPDKSSIISCDKDFWISHGEPWSGTQFPVKDWLQGSWEIVFVTSMVGTGFWVFFGFFRMKSKKIPDNPGPGPQGPPWRISSFPGSPVSHLVPGYAWRALRAH